MLDGPPRTLLEDGRTPETSAWFLEVGVDRFPFLSDHRLSGVRVFPGTVAVEIALAAAAAAARPSNQLRDIRFEQVCIIPSSGVRRLEVTLPAGRDGRRTVMIASGGHVGKGSGPDRRRTIHVSARLAAPAEPSPDLAETMRRARAVRRAGVVIPGDAFYAGLRVAGNDYGPAFSTVQRVWRSGDEASGLLRAGHGLGADPPDWLLRALLLDAAVQLVAAAADLDGRPFVLADCADLRIHGPVPAEAEGYARIRSRDADAKHSADVVVADSTGRAVAELGGVGLHLMGAGPGRTRSRGTSAPRRPTLAVAATFEADQFRAALDARLASVPVPLRVIHERHAGPIADLTSAGSSLAANHDGVNLIVLRSEDVFGGKEHGSPRRFTVPGLGDISHLHHYESQYLYDEIFAREAYLRHGITLAPGDIVFDVGANIGMFSLFAQARFPGVRLYAFEPAPAPHSALRENMELYCPGGRAFNYGIADRNEELPFTYYPNSTVFSGFGGDSAQDERNIRTVVENVLHTKVPSGALNLRPIVERLLRDRLVAEVHPCRTRTLSSVLRELDVPRIDLLKIDTEGSELLVLDGIEGQDWDRIRQIALEAHGRTAEKAITSLLESRGFLVFADQEEHLLRGTTLTSVVARRPGDPPCAPVERPGSPDAGGPAARRVNRLVQLVAALRRSTGVPCIVCLQPAPHAAAGDGRRHDQQIVAALSAVPGVLVVTGDGVAGSPDRDLPRSDLLDLIATTAARAVRDLS